MFQNPQQRAGGGIMAGVAPINMSNGGSSWSDIASGVGGDAYDLGSEVAYFGGDIAGNVYDGINMPSPEELGISYGEDGLGFDSSQLGEFADEQFTPTDSGIVGIINGEEITARDAFNFFVVDPDDPVDRNIAAASVALLAVPFAGWAAAGVTTLGRYGYKGAKAFKALKKLKQEDGVSFAPSKDAGTITSRFLKRRVSADKESIEGGFGKFAPGARAAQYQTNRLLGEYVPEAIDLVIPSARADETAEFEDALSDEDKNLISSSQQQASQAPYPEIPEYEGGPVETPAGIAAIDNQTPRQIDTMVQEAETDAEGGIANVARSIAEARSDSFKSPTFRRGDKDLAAVTKEDLIDNGYEGPGALTDYLNDMKFDDELGEYIKDIEAKGKANGGIMNLKYGKFIDNLISSFKGRRKKSKDKTQEEDDAVKKAEETAFPGAAQARTQDSVPFDLGPRVPGPRSGGGKPGSKAEVETPSGKVTDDVNVKTGNIFSKYPKTTFAVGSIAALNAANALLSPDEEEVAGPSSGGGSSVIEEEPVFTQVDGKNQPAPFPINPNKDLITKTTDYLKGSLSKLKDQYASDPRKGLFIAGQLMKAREGIVPINGITALTEAEMQYENLIAEEKSKGNDGKPPLFQMYDAIVEEQIALGNPMSEKVKQEVLASLFDATRSNEFMTTLFKGIALNPQLLAEGKITDVITKTAIDAGGDIGALLTAHGNNRPST